MFRKKFVSLVFSSKKIQVLYMESSKKKVLNYFTIDLPQGLIVNNSVKDPERLGLIIKDGLDKHKIRQRSVGIVIPEFSTYIKIMSLPRIDKGDINEAIRWQAQDFLPAPERDITLDWRIIEESDSGVQILIASIRKDILQGYIGAVSSVGLYPMVVETPSLSLSRIARRDNNAKIIIYVYYDETVIVLAQKESILATSVASSTSQREIVSSAARMVKHYTVAKADKIIVSGVSLASDFIENLKKFVGLPVELIDINYQGIKKEDIQEYLIALSLQQKDPAIPENEYTINLIPSEWEKVYKNRISNLEIWILTLIGSVGLWISFLAMLSIYLLLSLRWYSINTELASTGNEESQKIYDEVASINQLSTKIIDTQANYKSPVEYINLINSTKTPGITINRVHVDMEAGTIGVNGIADTRTTLVDWKDKLAQQDSFLSVLLPPSSYIEEANIDFELGINFAANTQKNVIKLKL